MIRKVSTLVTFFGLSYVAFGFELKSFLGLPFIFLGAEDDLDWKMDDLNKAELDLLSSVLEEDGCDLGVVHDPKKESALVRLTLSRF